MYKIYTNIKCFYQKKFCFCIVDQSSLSNWLRYCFFGAFKSLMSPKFFLSRIFWLVFIPLKTMINTFSNLAAKDVHSFKAFNYPERIDASREVRNFYFLNIYSTIRITIILFFKIQFYKKQFWSHIKKKNWI